MQCLAVHSIMGVPNFGAEHTCREATKTRPAGSCSGRFSLGSSFCITSFSCCIVCDAVYLSRFATGAEVRGYRFNLEACRVSRISRASSILRGRRQADCRLLALESISGLGPCLWVECIAQFGSRIQPGRPLPRLLCFRRPCQLINQRYRSKILTTVGTR